LKDLAENGKESLSVAVYTTIIPCLQGYLSAVPRRVSAADRELNRREGQILSFRPARPQLSCAQILAA
jgi:hypothetical protein